MIKSIIMLLATSLTGINAPAVLLATPVMEESIEASYITVSGTGDTICSPASSSKDALCDKDTGKDFKETKIITEREIIEDYFADTPILVEIARCESSFRQTDENGEVLRGVYNNRDVGVMQINERFHLEKAQDKEIDIYSIEGNLEFAKYLYEKEGVRPWKASEKCWRSKA